MRLGEQGPMEEAATRSSVGPLHVDDVYITTEDLGDRTSLADEPAAQDGPAAPRAPALGQISHSDISWLEVDADKWFPAEGVDDLI